MNSFTFNFSIRRVLIALVVVAVVIECAMRIGEEHVSLDVKHIRSIPHLAAELNNQPHAGKRVLMIGNSLAREAVLDDSLLAACEEPLPWIGRVNPDASSLREWYFLYRKEFASRHALPDLLVIFSGSAHLRDGPYNPEKLGSFFVSNEDVPLVLRHHLGSLEEQVPFLLARFSVAFTNRERVAPRVFTSLVPDYQNGLTRVNRIGALRRASLQDVPGEFSYHLLDQFLEEIQESGVRAVIVFLPLPEEYALDEKMLSVAARHDVAVLNLQDTLLFSPDLFPDAYHLNLEGAELLSDKLAPVFAQIVKQIPEKESRTED